MLGEELPMSIIAIARASMLGRWLHRSRIGGGVSPRNVPLYVLIGALCVTFATLNLPGEPQQPRYSGPWMRESDTFEIRHGWPLIFATRRVSIPYDAEDFDGLLKSRNVWALGVGLTRLGSVALVVDLVVAALAVVAAARIFLWLQAIGWPRRFTVRTLLGAMLANAILCACFCGRGAAEPRVGGPSVNASREIRGCGPAWLRQIVGAWPLSRFDKTVGLCLLSREPRLRFTLEDAHQLSLFPSLEEVTLNGFHLTEDATHQLALLPRLKSICIQNCTITADAVPGIPTKRAPDGRLFARPGEYLLVRKGDASVLVTIQADASLSEVVRGGEMVRSEEKKHTLSRR
jgi:hypothetical protein